MTRTMLATLTVLLLFGSPTKADEIDDLVAQVSLANLQAHVATLAATPRDSDQSQAAAADYIAAQLESYGYTVLREPVAGDFGLGTSENIVAQLPGMETPERVFIVGAHFDSVQSSPGADDNASGVAGLLEIARVLAGSSFASSIELVAFAHEEIGLLGSQQHAAATWAAGREVIGMISLEMIGYTCFTPGCAVIFPDLLPCFDVQGSIPSVLGDWIGVVANADHASLGQVFFDTGSRYVPSLLVGWATVLGAGSCFPATRRSDHAPFWDYGYPALLVTDTADFRNPNYHGVGDVFATLDFSFAQQVTQATLATAATSASPVNELGPTSIEVSKTASFDGRYVSGKISITNTGENPALLSAMADSLEVHFPRKGKSTPPPLPEGSTPNWFKVADVPVENPGLIPVGETASIDYSFDLCAAADFTGANSMRNVVAVTLANKPEKAKKDTVVTRSDSFEPQTPDCPCAHDLCVVGSPLDPSCDTCAAAICAVDPYCCEVEWDFICVAEVSTVCGESCCHDPCVVGNPLDPSCGQCAEAICAVDPFCCEVEWDVICVDEVSTICGGTCPGLLLDSLQTTARLQSKADVCGEGSER